MFFLLIFLFFPSFILCQLRSFGILYSTPENCTLNQYYNRIELRCQSCPNSTIPSPDRLECICPPNQKIISNQLFISICEQCPEGSSVSPDQLDCLRCRNGTCECSDQSILVYRQPSGNIIETGAYCEACSTGYQKNEEGTCEKNEFCQNCTTSYFSRIKLQNGDDMRSNYISQNLPIAVKKCAERDMKYCEVLVNLCVLQNFDYSSQSNACGILENIKRAYNPWQSSWDPIEFVDDSELEKDNVIDHEYLFAMDSYLDIVLARYDKNGIFEGYFEDTTYHFCGQEMYPKSAFLFGRKYLKNCQIQKSLYTYSKVQGKLFEAFLKFQDESGRTKMYPIHILNSAIRINDQLVNQNTIDSNRWVLTRRFFLFDDYSMMFDNSSKLYRFASKITLFITLRRSKDGFITPPYFKIQYDDSINDVMYSSFGVEYQQDSSNYDQNLTIVFSVLIPLSVFISAINAYSWSRRMGKSSAVDASSIIYFIMCEITNLGNLFFLIFSIIAILYTYSYRNQTHAFYDMPNDDHQRQFFIYFIVALILKFISLLVTIGSTVFQETFFIDWERQKLKQTGEQTNSRDLTKSNETESVVVWRTYMVANEFNELQQFRKTSLALQLFVIIVAYEYFQLKKFALIQPSDASDDPGSVYTQTCIMSKTFVILWLYIPLELLQVFANIFLFERISYNAFIDFIDLCSISNISVLTLTHRLYGFYVHGRSVHGKGDAGMREMNAFLQRERDDLCGFRGLEPSSELQTFIVNLPNLFRTNYDEISQLIKQPMTGGVVGYDALTLQMNATVEAHDKMNNFLKKFIDHSISDVDYNVQDRPLLEAVLDVEMTDTSQTGMFTRDPSQMGFSSCFVYGNEWSWASFECLLLCVIFISSDSLIFAAFVVYITSKVLRRISSYLSTAHLVKTSFIDQRFLI